MKLLLTGASGFVGSHILDYLCAQGLSTAVLLRPSSDRRFLARHLPSIEVRTGSITDPESLAPALAGITHVIHCAGCTKARTISEFYQINESGTRNLVAAINAQSVPVKRLLHISSLAAIGPAVAAQPAREDDPPHPVSHYGKSKLAGELEVRNHCQAAFTIIRPPAVYGPRDQGFLSMFKAVDRHLRPRPATGQALSLIFVRDLAAAALACLEHPRAAGRAYFVAGPGVVSGRRLAEEIAAQANRWTVPFPLPTVALWPVCWLAEIRSRITGKANVLSLQKYAELRAPGWVCDASRFEREVGFRSPTRLPEGIAETLAWYRNERWL